MQLDSHAQCTDSLATVSSCRLANACGGGWACVQVESGLLIFWRTKYTRVHLLGVHAIRRQQSRSSSSDKAKRKTLANNRHTYTHLNLKHWSISNSSIQIQRVRNRRILRRFTTMNKNYRKLRVVYFVLFEFGNLKYLVDIGVVWGAGFTLPHYFPKSSYIVYESHIHITHDTHTHNWALSRWKGGMGKALHTQTHTHTRELPTNVAKWNRRVPNDILSVAWHRYRQS